MASLLGCSCRTVSAKINHVSLLKFSNPMAQKSVHFSTWRQTMNLLKNSVLLKSRTDILNGTRSLHLLRKSFNRTVYKDSEWLVLKQKHGSKNVLINIRHINSGKADKVMSKPDALLYVLSLLVLSGGLAYAGVPFFKIFCRQFGFGGNTEYARGHDRTKVGTMEVIKDRDITVFFTADTHASMRWNFKPQQPYIKVKPGETALAFYTAKNPTDKPIIGIATYTVNPYIAAPYFNKIQCFCFEEQILNPHEQVDMPVFFYIDPEYDEDPFLEFEDEITLSYTFFEAKEGWNLPLPGFMKVDQNPETEKTPV